MIKVLAFARYRALLGFEHTEFPLPEPPRLDVLLNSLPFEKLPKEALLARNQTFVQRNSELEDGDEVALMPPVSGG